MYFVYSKLKIEHEQVVLSIGPGSISKKGHKRSWKIEILRKAPFAAMLISGWYGQEGKAAGKVESHSRVERAILFGYSGYTPTRCIPERGAMPQFRGTAVRAHLIVVTKRLVTKRGKWSVQAGSLWPRLREHVVSRPIPLDAKSWVDARTVDTKRSVR